MTEDEKFVREHWTVQRVGEGYVWIVLEHVQVGYADWADAASFVRQRLEEIRQAEEDIRQTQEGIDILSRVGATGNTNGQLDDCARAIGRILAREQKILVRKQERLASLKRGMKEPQP